MILGRTNLTTGEIEASIDFYFPHELPGLPPYLTWTELAAHLDRSAQPTPTCIATAVAGVVQWRETATLDMQRAAKVEAMRLACAEHIVAGFQCAALGTAHHYPAKPQDQANLVASVTDSLLAGGGADWRTPFWCMDEAGVWEFRLHTIAQIQQVGREAKAAILAAMGKNESLRQQIDVASAEQLAGIDW